MEPVENPYAAPASVVADLTVQPEGNLQRAGKWVRFFNLIIDQIAMAFFGGIVGGAIGFIGGILGGEAFVRWLESDPSVAANYALGILMSLLYYVPFEYLTGRSPAKWITGCKVVNVDGDRPGFGQIVGRTFARMIPFEPFSFLGSTGRGWHDTLPKVYVVRTR
jgi:uncharacterized RDD family membrane protein YckC